MCGALSTGLLNAAGPWKTLFQKAAVAATMLLHPSADVCLNPYRLQPFVVATFCITELITPYFALAMVRSRPLSLDLAASIVRFELSA